MAVTRATKVSNHHASFPGAPTRVSFAKLDQPLEVPDLLALQTQSFEWLVGSEEWFERRVEAGEELPVGGLEEVLSEISPIEDFSGSMSLSFSDPRFDEVKASVEECKDKDMTYSAPLFVTAEFTNNTTGEIKSQTVFMGDFPVMTDKGTFIINGTERVVVSQLVRSPGVYFDRSVDKATDKDVFSVKIIPSRGAWLEFDVDKRDTVGVRIDRKRRQPVTVLLKALGWTTEQIQEKFRLLRDAAGHPREGLTRPGRTRPCSTSTASCVPASRRRASRRRRCWRTSSSRTSATTSRRSAATRSTRSWARTVDPSVGTLTEDDIVTTIAYLVRLHAGETEVEAETGSIPVETDDIDHFGNRRLRTVGELIQNQIRVGLSRMERVVRERMTTQDVEAITPQTLINIRPVVAAIKEFFGTSQLSQFMDQTNPLAGLTHKRRLSALGPGGLSRERAGMEVRDVHPSHYGRMCPIETPEGPNIGLIGSLSSFARVNPFGFIETPYRKVVDGVVIDQIDYLTADEEDRFVVAQANAPLDEDGHFSEERVLVRRKGGDVDLIAPTRVDYMDVSPRQMVSVATAHDPVPRARRRQPRAHGREHAASVGAAAAFRVAAGRHRAWSCAPRSTPATSSRRTAAGVVEELCADYITIMDDEGQRTTHRLHKFRGPTRAPASTRSRSSRRATASRSARSSPTGRAPRTARWPSGKNLLVAIMPWEGHNYEDAIILSQRLVQDDVLTSIHIEEHEIDARDTKLGAEEITRDIPNVSEEVLADLDERGIIRIGAEVRPTATSSSAR